MTRLEDVFDMAALDMAIVDGYVRRQLHPFESLAILNYTDRCQFDQAWTDVTLRCRGLIYDTNTLEIVARGWPKFFNYGDEKNIPSINEMLYEDVQVTDKMDGSLGILYLNSHGDVQVATRGSFTSDQALHATSLLQERYGDWKPPPGVTVLVEIIYPGNRIVVDYGDQDDLVFLGVLDTATGVTLSQDPVSVGWPGPATTVLPYDTLAEAVRAEPRRNAEGMVVHFLATDQRVKLKQEDYKALHRILTGTSARTIWQYIVVNLFKDAIQKPSHWGTYLGIDAGRAAQIISVGPLWRDALLAKVPDEFYDWFKETYDGLHTNVRKLRNEITSQFVIWWEQTSDRKSFAALAHTHKHRGAMYLLADERPLDMYLWMQFFPEAERPFRMISEDVA